MDTEGETSQRLVLRRFTMQLIADLDDELTPAGYLGIGGCQFDCDEAQVPTNM